jgi:hypothetical protein
VDNDVVAGRRADQHRSRREKAECDARPASLSPIAAAAKREQPADDRAAPARIDVLTVGPPCRPVAVPFVLLLFRAVYA